MTAAGGEGATAFTARWAEWSALAVFALTPLIGYLAPLGFAPLVGLGGLIAAPALLRARRFDPWPVGALALLLAWMAISMRWSPFHAKHLSTSVLTRVGFDLLFGVAMIGAYAAMAKDAARRAAAVLAGATLLLALFLLADALAGARVYHFLKLLIGQPIGMDLARRNIAQAAYVVALLFWPTAQALGRLGWRTAAGPILLMAAAVVAAKMLLLADAPMYALLAGGLAWLAVRWLGATAARLLLLAGVLLFGLAPLLVVEGVRSGFFAWLHERLEASWDARLDIWSFVTRAIVEHPLRGWGVDASRSFGPSIPLHPHNGALQVWLELGAPGAILACVLVAWLSGALAALSRVSPSQAAAGAGGMTAYMVIGSLSFGVWQEWWVALGCLTVAALAVACRAWPAA